MVDPDRPVAPHDPDVERHRLAGERGIALGDGAFAVVLVDVLQRVHEPWRLSGPKPMSRQSSGDQVSSPATASMCQEPTPAICCASVRSRSLRRSSSSARLRAVMSVEMPITATAAPLASNTGVLWVRCVRPSQPSSTSIGRPVASTWRFCSAQRSTVTGSKSSAGILPATSSGGFPTSSQAARLA